MDTASSSGSADSRNPILCWTEPLLCFILPISNWLFLSSGPHSWQGALWWTLPVWLCVAADYFSPADRLDPKPDEIEWLLDARLYFLFALQIANIALLLELASRLRWETPADIAASAANIAAMRILTGTTSCCSGIAVAHELIHRRAKHLRWMGRIMLWTVCYDHFFVEHGHGHHRKASTPLDPASARFGERFQDFFKRSLRGQWISAWRMENQRLRAHSNPMRFLRHRVLLGLLMEIALVGLIFLRFGPVALTIFLYQAWAAVRLLEAVNYIQHWGLSRSGTGFEESDAWSTGSWFTLHSFIGLARHADHHRNAGKSCSRLLHTDDSPEMPYGYFTMSLMVRLFNERYIRAARLELESRGLGPFRPCSELSGV